MSFRMKHRRIGVLVLALLLSGAAGFVFCYKLRGHWHEVAEAFGGANYTFLIPAVLVTGLLYVFRTSRWRLFLRPVQGVSFAPTLRATCIGFMASCVLPLRAGELIRPYVLHRNSGVPLGAAAGTGVGLERVFDLMAACMLLLLTFALLSWGEPPRMERPGTGAEQMLGVSTESAEEVSSLGAQMRDKGIWLAGMAGCGAVVMLAIAFAPGLLLKPAEVALRFFPGGIRSPLNAFLKSLTESMQFLKSPIQVAMAMGLSLAVWFCYPVSTFFVAKAFALDLPFVGALFVHLLITVAVVPPQAPAFIGLFHVAAMTGATLFGVSEGRAGAFASLLWAVNIVPISVIGLLFLWQEGLGLSFLTQGFGEISQARTSVKGGVDNAS